MTDFTESNRNLKIILGSVILGIASVSFFFFDYIVSNIDKIDPQDFGIFFDIAVSTSFIPYGTLAGACIEVLIIALLFEIWIRRESLIEFRKALFDPQIVERNFTSEQVDRTLLAAINTKVSERDYATDIVEFLNSSSLADADRRYHATYSIILSPVSAEFNEDTRTHYFDAIINYEYQKVLRARTLRFKCTDVKTEFDSFLNDRNIEWRWLDNRKRLFQKFNSDFFSISNFAVNGEVLQVRSIPLKTGDVSYEVRVPNKISLGATCRFSYTVTVKVEAFSNCMFVDIREPTKGVRVQLDFAKVPVSHMNVFDSFSSKKDARVEWFPAWEKPRAVSISIDDWVIPKSGVLFTWILSVYLDDSVKKRHLHIME